MLYVLSGMTVLLTLFWLFLDDVLLKSWVEVVVWPLRFLSLLQTAPELVDSLAMEHQSVVSISAGARHCLAVAERGQIFAWGWNKYGQLGLGDTEDRLTPTRVRLHESPSPPLVEKKSAGGRKLVMATLAGSVDLRSSLSVPLDKEGVQVLKVSCGAWHSTMLVENHTSC